VDLKAKESFKFVAKEINVEGEVGIGGKEF
jgi:hypothetical protein